VESFEAIFVSEYPKMVALAAAVSGDRSTAEDVAQEAMTRMNRDWAKVQGYESPGSWVRRVTINLALSRRRRLASEARAVLRLGRPEPTLPPATPGDDRVWAAVAALPRNQRAAIALFFLEERTITEIADILDISPATARVHLHRARQTLRDRLADFDPSADDQEANR
jgi:RNA polymerase sigma-70 factor (ECF subfamily)